MCVLSCYHVCACMGCLLYVLVSVCKRVKVATVQVDNRKHLVGSANKIMKFILLINFDGPSSQALL
jgi:hypothetical protein